MTKKQPNTTNFENILLVDADPHALEVLQGRFERLTLEYNYEYKYTAEKSIDSAKQELKKTKYVAIITELVFQSKENEEPQPEVGYKFIKYLTEKYPKLNVICLTGCVDKDIEEKIDRMKDKLALSSKKPIFNTEIIKILKMSKDEQ